MALVLVDITPMPYGTTLLCMYLFLFLCVATKKRKNSRRKINNTPESFGTPLIIQIKIDSGQNDPKATQGLKKYPVLLF